MSNIIENYEFSRSAIFKKKASQDYSSRQQTQPSQTKRNLKQTKQPQISVIRALQQQKSEDRLIQKDIFRNSPNQPNESYYKRENQIPLNRKRNLLKKQVTATDLIRPESSNLFSKNQLIQNFANRRIDNYLSQLSRSEDKNPMQINPLTPNDEFMSDKKEILQKRKNSAVSKKYLYRRKKTEKAFCNIQNGLIDMDSESSYVKSRKQSDYILINKGKNKSVVNLDISQHSIESHQPLSPKYENKIKYIETLQDEYLEGENSKRLSLSKEQRDQEKKLILSQQSEKFFFKNNYSPVRENQQTIRDQKFRLKINSDSVIQVDRIHSSQNSGQRYKSNMWKTQIQNTLNPPPSKQKNIQFTIFGQQPKIQYIERNIKPIKDYNVEFYIDEEHDENQLIIKNKYKNYARLLRNNKQKLKQ